MHPHTQSNGIFYSFTPPTISVAKKRNGENVSIEAAYNKGDINWRLKFCIQTLVHFYAQFNIFEGEQQKFAPF